MARSTLQFGFLAVALGVPCGCSENSRPTSPAPAPVAEETLRSKIVGRWTTSTAPEMAGSASTISFLESGEYRASGVLMVQGQPVMMEKDGKKVPVPSTFSGVWDLSGEEIRVRITQANIQGKFESIVYTIREASAKRLLLDRAGEEIALIRVE